MLPSFSPSVLAELHESNTTLASFVLDSQVPVMIILDLVCVASRSWEASTSLLDMAKNRFVLQENAFRSVNDHLWVNKREVFSFAVCCWCALTNRQFVVRSKFVCEYKSDVGVLFLEGLLHLGLHCPRSRSSNSPTQWGSGSCCCSCLSC